MASNPIDYLLEALEEGVSDDDEAEPQQSQRGVQQQSPNHSPQQLHVVQSPVRSNSPLLRHLSSGSARRRIVKNRNCLFCRRDLEKLELEGHLQSDNVCFTLYKRKIHCNSINGILIRLYEKECLFCNRQQGNSLQLHLEDSPQCRQSYFNRYNVDQIK